MEAVTRRLSTLDRFLPVWIVTAMGLGLVLGRGSTELAAVLVALNSVFQILTYSLLGYFLLAVVPAWFGADTAALDVSMWTIARSVLIFLGIPLLAGYLTRRTLVAKRGAAWYDGVLRISLPLVVYFVTMFGLAFVVSAKLGFSYAETASLSFTAAGNNFELAIAVAIATFGIGSGEALAAAIGPLIEVPALVTLVYASLWAKRRFFSPSGIPA